MEYNKMQIKDSNMIFGGNFVRMKVSQCVNYHFAPSPGKNGPMSGP